MPDLKINADDWDELSNQDRKKIVDILRGCGLIGANDRVIGDPNEPPLNIDNIVTSKTVGADNGSD